MYLLLIKQSNKLKVIEEIKKCIVLCSNCHRDLHYQEKLESTNREHDRGG